MNHLHLGFSKNVELPDGAFAFIGDTVPKLPRWRRARVFDPLKHSFNPLEGMSYKRARELAEVLYTIAPQGENTLTVRNGKRALLKALLKADRLDKVDGDEEVNAMIGDLLVSPVLERVLCKPDNLFDLEHDGPILVRLDRGEIGEFDALVLGFFLINLYPGQVVIDDLGFYGRNQHANLVRENRLIGGVEFLELLPDKLRNAVLSVEDKTLKHASSADAELVAKLDGLVRGTNAYNDFVSNAVG